MEEEQPKPVRKTINLSKALWIAAEARMRAEGFNNNFSQYISSLIRQDKEALAASQAPTAELKESPPNYRVVKRRRKRNK